MKIIQTASFAITRHQPDPKHREPVPVHLPSNEESQDEVQEEKLNRFRRHWYHGANQPSPRKTIIP